MVERQASQTKIKFWTWLEGKFILQSCAAFAFLSCSAGLLNIYLLNIFWISSGLIRLPCDSASHAQITDLAKWPWSCHLNPAEHVRVCPRQLHTLKMEHVPVASSGHICALFQHVSTPYNGHCGPCQIDRSTPSIQLRWPWPWHCGFQLIRVWCCTNQYHNGHKLLPGCCTQDSQPKQAQGCSKL